MHYPLLEGGQDCAVYLAFCCQWGSCTPSCLLKEGGRVLTFCLARCMRGEDLPFMHCMLHAGVGDIALCYAC